MPVHVQGAGRKAFIHRKNGGTARTSFALNLSRVLFPSNPCGEEHEMGPFD